jgi:hypothetical protein
MLKRFNFASVAMAQMSKLEAAMPRRKSDEKN